MTGFGLIFFHLAQAAKAAVQKTLTWKDLLWYEAETRSIAGVASPHPSHKSPLIPFLEMFFSDFKAWLSEKNLTSQISHLTSVLNGVESETFEIRYDAKDVANMKTVPLWYKQTLEAADRLIADPKDPLCSGEKAAALIRNIPEDTTLGMLSHDLIRILVGKSPNLEKARSILSYLKGEKPFHCKVTIRGLFVTLNYS